MSTSPLMIVTQNSAGQSQAAASSAMAANGMHNIGLEGQTHFLTLLLSQVNSAQSSGALTQTGQLAGHLSNQLSEHMQALLSRNETGLSAKTANISNNQTTLNEAALKLRAFLSGLLENQSNPTTTNSSATTSTAGSTASLNGAVNTAASGRGMDRIDSLLQQMGASRDDLNQTVSRIAIEQAFANARAVDNAGQFHAQEDLLSARLTPGTLTEAISKALQTLDALGAENGAQQQGTLSADAQSLINSNQGETLKQALLLTSGVTLEEMSQLTQLADQELAQATNGGLIIGFSGKDAPLFQPSEAALQNAAGNAANAGGRAANGRNGSAVNGEGNGMQAGLLAGAAGAQGQSQANASMPNETASLQSAPTNTNPLPPIPSAADPFSTDNFFNLPQGASATGLPDDAGAQMNGGQTLNNNGLNAGGLSAQALANPTTAHPQAAGRPHPSSEHMAVQIQRHAANSQGDSKFTIAMDPPQLGKVSVELTMGKNKEMHAKIVAEKPEALLMLQRDQQVLTKALGEMGLDASGDNLSFDLASQDSANNGNDNGGNRSSQNNSGMTENAGSGDLVETQMTEVFVDPRTGHLRVNIMA